MPGLRRSLCPLLLAIVGGGCWRSPPSAPGFEIVRTSPSLAPGGEPLLLNDSITVYFSDAIQPLSVTGDSVTVLDESGHRVPGSLRTGSTWVTFEPRPPLAPDLGDGSFRPGGVYQLQVAGIPRPDAVRAADGRRLLSARSFEVRVASRDHAVPGLPAPLRPPAVGLPFLLRPSDSTQQLPADAPRLRLHFTLPVLPTTAVADALEVRLLRNRELLLPRSVRVTTSVLDEYPGSTVEVDLGSTPRLRSGTGAVALRPGDYVSVTLGGGSAALRDYAGSVALPSSAQYWSVVAGTSITLVEWPEWPVEDGAIHGDDPVLPGFEAVSGTVRPRVRVEAGDGSLGIFRPSRDTVLCPGRPFDRGDGVEVVSRGASFPFLAIDVPAGITVRLDASQGPVQLLACGSIRIAGHLQLVGPTAPLRLRRNETAAAQELLEAATTALLAGGEVHLRGQVTCTEAPAADRTALTIGSAGRRIHLAGELPYNTILAVESAPTEPAGPAIVGARGQTVVVPATFTYGLPPGAQFPVRGDTPWRQLPPDRDGGTLRLVDLDSGLSVGWQSTPADPVLKSEPDLRPGRVGRVQPAADLDHIAAEPGAFVRFRLEAKVVSGQPLPQLRELRLVDR